MSISPKYRLRATALAVAALAVEDVWSRRFLAAGNRYIQHRGAQG
eukprot:COSAG04_NODE_26363_length_295_cov_1.321429_1_plen_44_part_01